MSRSTITAGHPHSGELEVTYKQHTETLPLQTIFFHSLNFSFSHKLLLKSEKHAISNASTEQINKIIYSITNSLFYQLKGKIHYECPCSQFEFCKWNGRVHSFISKYGSGFLFMILQYTLFKFYILFFILISPSLRASKNSIYFWHFYILKKKKKLHPHVHVYPLKSIHSLMVWEALPKQHKPDHLH